MGDETIEKPPANVKVWFEFFQRRPAGLKTKIRAADAKEVGVGNPAEETCCYPNAGNVTFLSQIVNDPASSRDLQSLRGFIFKLFAADTIENGGVSVCASAPGDRTLTTARTKAPAPAWPPAKNR
jgi:hypothetical protein